MSNKLIADLMSFRARMVADNRTQLMFEGDFDTIDQAIATLRKATIAAPQQAIPADAVIAAARKTIDENGYLADGDDCTLYDLREALAAYDASPTAPIDNVAKALSKANIPDARKFIFHGLNGCSNHGCIIHGPRNGMGTNGPCHCVSDLSRQQMSMLGQRLDHFLRALIPDTQAKKGE
jgi:hypothetical protein